jgi:predicted transcriptional regulator
MMEAGGQKFARGVVVGDLAKKAADALLADLGKQGYIRKDGSKFTITEEGRQAWERRASEARKQELADRVVAEFLAVVVKQNGKALTASQRQRFNEGFIKRVQADELVVEAGANKYKLSSKGEEFLEAREPLEGQLKRLRSATQDLLKAPQALLQRLAKETEKLAEGGAIRSAFVEARAAIQGEVERAQAEFERSLDGLQAFASLIAAAQAFNKALPAAVSGALERINAEAERVQKLEAELRQTADQFREQLGQARQQMERRASAVEEKARAEQKPEGAGGTTTAPSSATAAEPASDEAIWQATRRAYEQLEQRFKMTTELIKVPNLTDIVRAEVPGLTVPRFHDLLQRWQSEDRLVLQVCNDPHFEPRAAEGIPSSRGLLFYVEMK